jgi:hypothetical protein
MWTAVGRFDKTTATRWRLIVTENRKEVGRARVLIRAPPLLLWGPGPTSPSWLTLPIAARLSPPGRTMPMQTGEREFLRHIDKRRASMTSDDDNADSAHTSAGTGPNDKTDLFLPPTAAAAHA